MSDRRPYAIDAFDDTVADHNPAAAHPHLQQPDAPPSDLILVVCPEHHTAEVAQPVTRGYSCKECGRDYEVSEIEQFRERGMVRI